MLEFLYTYYSILTFFTYTTLMQSCQIKVVTQSDVIIIYQLLQMT